MAGTIRLGDDDISMAKEAAKLNNRSTAGQIAHWMNIGRIIEQSPTYDHARVAAALKAEFSYDELSAAEQDVYLDEFYQSMREPSKADEAAFLAEIENVEEPAKFGLFSNGTLDEYASALRTKKPLDEALETTWINTIKTANLIDARGERGFTILMWAIMCDQRSSAKKLIKAGADITLADEAGNTPIHVAARMNNNDMLRDLLLAAGPQTANLVNDKTGISVLIEAASNSQTENVRHLLDSKVDLDYQDKAGNTALHFATGFSSSQIALMLITEGASPFIENRGGTSFADIMDDQREDIMSTAYLEVYRNIMDLLKDKKSLKDNNPKNQAG